MQKLRKIEITFTNGKVNSVGHATIEHFLTDEDRTPVLAGKTRAAFDLSGPKVVFGKNVSVDIEALAQEVADAVKRKAFVLPANGLATD